MALALDAVFLYDIFVIDVCTGDFFNEMFLL